MAVVDRVGVSGETACGSWNDFAALANFKYDRGYVGQEIHGGLKVVGDDWWLERGEYDGSEWWEFKSLPEKPSKPTALSAQDLKNH